MDLNVFDFYEIMYFSFTLQSRTVTGNTAVSGYLGYLSATKYYIVMQNEITKSTQVIFTIEIETCNSLWKLMVV